MKTIQEIRKIASLKAAQTMRLRKKTKEIIVGSKFRFETNDKAKMPEIKMF